jgi:hypothetical protein
MAPKFHRIEFLQIKQFTDYFTVILFQFILEKNYTALSVIKFDIYGIILL